MHVFLAGATGVLGRRIVPLLVDQGHRVTAMTRSADAVGTLQAMGADPFIADALHADQVASAVLAAAPDVVMHQLTDLSTGTSPSNAALRTVGTRNLMDAANSAGVHRVIGQSIAWVYAGGDRPAVESTPLDLDAPEPRRTTVRGIQALERAIAEVPHWVALRYGLLYGPDTWYRPDGSKADEARAGGIVADDQVSSFVHVDDAARAAVEALAWPSGPVNICDDEPAAASAWVPAFCAAVGAPEPPVTSTPARPSWARGADNGYARHELGWKPAYRSWRTGFAAPAE